MLKDYFFIAFRSLRKRVLRTSLTMLGIFIGIAAVVSLVSLGHGMQSAVSGQFSGLGSDKIIVQGVQAMFGPPGQNTAGVVTERDLRLVRRVPGVSRAAGRLMRSVAVEYGGESEVIFGVSLPQLPDDRDLVLESINLKLDDGRMMSPRSSGKVVVGYDVWSGGVFDRKIWVGSKILVNGKKFEVVGLLSSSSTFAHEAVLFNEDDFRELLGEDDVLSAVVAQVSKGEAPARVGDRVLRVLRRDRGQKEGFEDVQVQTSEELISSVNLILGVVQVVFVGIALISLLVGGIGIMNTMYTAVLERTREIGVMKAIGARNGDVLWVFIIESGLLGLVGGSVGVLLGMGLSKLVEVSADASLGGVLQASFPLSLILGALSFSFLIGVFSGVFPAIQASRMHPVEALRE